MCTTRAAASLLPYGPGVGPSATARTAQAEAAAQGEAAELKKLEEAEAARKAAEQAAALLLQSSAHVVLSMDATPAPVLVPENEQVAQVVEAEADKENTTADAPAEDDASTDSEDERGDDQVASAPDARTVWVSVGQDAST